MNPLLRLSVLALLFSLTACAPSRVHLHSYNVTETERDKVAQELEASGLAVVISKRKPPLLNMGSFIIYPKADGDNGDLSKILSVINEHGYSTGLIARNRVKNHEYRDGNNIGLYLINSNGLLSLNEQLAAEYSLKLFEVEYSSINCPELYSLKLQKNGQGSITQNISLQTLRNNESATTIPLTWIRKGDSLEIITGQHKQKYSYSRQYEKAALTRMLVMTLTPLRNIRLENIRHLNCTFQSSTPLIE